jgi:sodium-dependent dicarboxylate transporter 2/3/5
MLPISTPPNALAYATGLVRLPVMVRSGIVLDCIGAITIWVMVYWLSPK